jgi:hypothetical protein
MVEAFPGSNLQYNISIRKASHDNLKGERDGRTSFWQVQQREGTA